MITFSPPNLCLHSLIPSLIAAFYGACDKIYTPSISNKERPPKMKDEYDDATSRSVSLQRPTAVAFAARPAVRYMCPTEIFLAKLF